MRAVSIHIYYYHINSNRLLCSRLYRYPYCDGKLCFVILFCFCTRTQYKLIHTHCKNTPSYTLCEVESGRVFHFLILMKISCLTYRCQTPLVLITNIAKVLLNFSSYLICRFIIYIVTLPACSFICCFLESF